MDEQDPSQKLDGVVEECRSSLTSTTMSAEMKGVKGEQALEESQRVLEQLKHDGCDLIGSLESSSAVRTDRQLGKRNETESDCKKLAEESDSLVRQIDGDLHDRWNADTSAPHQLTADIAEIKEMSGHILSAQQELINRLREELSLAETGIQSEIERETDDLGVMRRRMKEHLSATRDSHRAQLQRIDSALHEDYTTLLKDHSDRMSRILGDWSTSENDILQELNDLGERWDDDLTATDEMYFKKARRTRNALTTDIHLVERDLEKLKTSFALNNEILDYNCKILKLREEERAELVFRQKRRMARLNDRYRQLREELDRSGQEKKVEEGRIMKDLAHLRQDCQAMERKFATIKSANDVQLDSICRIAEDRIGELLKKLARIDERIFEEVLEQPWDGQVGGSRLSSSGSSSLDTHEFDQALNHIEKDLKFLMVNKDEEEAVGQSRRDRLKKALDVTDDQDFRSLMSGLGPTKNPSEITKELANRIRIQRTQSVDIAATRSYLTDAATIRTHFGRFKETAVPRARLELWKMLSKALIQYERILRDRIILATEILKS